MMLGSSVANVIDATSTQYNARALRAEKAGRRFAQPAARACDDDDFSCDISAHKNEAILRNNLVRLRCMRSRDSHWNVSLAIATAFIALGHPA
jgi:hypothetical protein